MGNVKSVGFSAFGFGCEINFKGDEVSSKQKIEGFLNQTGVDVVDVIRNNDEVVDDYFSENNLKKIKNSSEINGWVDDLSDTQADWLIQAFEKNAVK